jgi:hypothetical protein
MCTIYMETATDIHGNRNSRNVYKPSAQPVLGDEKCPEGMTFTKRKIRIFSGVVLTGPLVLAKFTRWLNGRI